MTRAVILALVSGWRRAPLQLVTLVTGLALATALWAGVQAINGEARASYDAASTTLGEGTFDQIVARDEGRIPLSTYLALRRAGWLVGPVVEGRIGGVRLVGVDPLTAPTELGPVELTGDEIASVLSEEGAVYGRADALSALPDGPARIVVPEVAPGTALTDIRVALRLLGRDDGFDRLVVADEQPLGRPPLAEIAPELELRPAGEGPDVASLTDSFHLNLTAFGALSFAVGIVIVHSAIGLAFEERRPVIRTLRALGVPVRTLVVVLGLELTALALIGGALGLVLGFLVAGALLPDVAATLRGLYGAEVAGSLTFRPGWALAGLAIALGGTALAGGGALVRLARMPPLAAGRRRAWAMATGRGRLWQAAAGVLALAVSLAAAWVGGGIVGGFVCLGALLVGGALVLPSLLDWALAAGERLARAPVPHWFWADSRQQLPGLSLALMALMLAMAANVGVSTMVSSFRLTFADFLDRRLAPDLYVEVPDAAAGADLERFGAERGIAVLPLMSVDRDLAGQPAEIRGARAHPTYSETWQFLAAGPDPWGRLAAGEGVLVSEQLARRADLWAGATLAVAPGVELPILGVYGDYGNPIGQAILDEALYLELFPDERPTQFGLRLEPGETEAVRAALRQELGLEDSAIVDQAALKALSMSIFERTFAVTGALNVLTLAVAGFAMLMSLLTLAGMRLPQLAPVWALGLTRAELGRLELVRAGLLALFTAVLALPFGLALAWVLLTVVNVEAFGWRLPLHLFPLDYLRLGALALLAGALAAVWPAWRLARTPPAALLKVFANER